MKHWLIGCLLPVWSLGADLVEIENDGRMELAARGASIRCTGETQLTLSAFRIRSEGQLVAFFGASLHLDAPGAAPETLRTKPQLISIVAVGQVEVSIGQGEGAVTTTGSRVVYRAADRSWQVDGRPWPGGTGKY